MAQTQPIVNGPYSSTATAEYYVSEVKDTSLIQVFGNQSLPVPGGTPNFEKFNTIESIKGFSVLGTEETEDLTFEQVSTRGQYKKLKALNRKTLWHYVKFPDTFVETKGDKPLVLKWQGDFSIRFLELGLNDTVKTEISVAVSSEVEEAEGLPTIP